MSPLLADELQSLQARVEQAFALGAEAASHRDALDAFHELRTMLEAGMLRAAEPDAESPTGWRVNAWVKRGILLGFRLGTLVEMGAGSYVDKHTYPARTFSPEQGVRVVPGGSSVRSGALLEM